MAKKALNIINMTPVVVRLSQIRKDFNKARPYKSRSLKAFGDAIGLPYATLFLVMRGEREINKTALDGLYKLGYSPEWLLSGDGEMKRGEKGSGKTLLTAVTERTISDEQVRTEVAAMRARMKSYEAEVAEIAEMRARMKVYEAEIDALKKELSRIKEMLKHGVNPV